MFRRGTRNSFQSSQRTDYETFREPSDSFIAYTRQVETLEAYLTINSEIAYELLRSTGKRVMEDLDDLHRMELHRPFTSTSDHFVQRRNEVWNQLRGIHFPTEDGQQFESEIYVKAYLIAYWEYSSQRFRDLVPMILETKLAKDFCIKLKEELESRLGLYDCTAFAICERYLQENEKTHAERNNLKDRERVLTEATDIFEKFRDEMRSS